MQADLLGELLDQKGQFFPISKKLCLLQLVSLIVYTNVESSGNPVDFFDIQMLCLVAPLFAQQKMVNHIGSHR